MEYRINNVIAGLDEKDYCGIIAGKIGTHRKNINNVRLLKRSVDARHGVKLVLSLAFSSDCDFRDKAGVFVYIPPENIIDKLANDTVNADLAELKERLSEKTVVVGSGPAGLFCALTLAKSGREVILIERGDDIPQRKNKVQHFWKTGRLDTESNVQFGLGGAGTFSDGKLTTGINDAGLFTVFDIFERFGANPDIKISSTPHIGTDVLEKVVANFRDELISSGVQVYFRTVLRNIAVKNGRVCGIETESNGITGFTQCDNIVLAIGHSSRDTFEMLNSIGVSMQCKPFAVGVRIEHERQLIDKWKYGEFTHRDLGAADYKMVEHLSNGRAVYTFCMCPGGVVTASSSEEGGVVTNGMSYHARNEKNSNSALLVNVTEKDFGAEDALAGVRFQREWERKVFNVFADYVAPAQNSKDFIEGRLSDKFVVTPTYQCGVKPYMLKDCLPSFVAESLKEALPRFGRKIKGFDTSGVMTAIESRSSSPVRIVRDNYGQSNILGLYPCGEGAGYAGGIVSAAVDGINVALKIISKK